MEHTDALKVKPVENKIRHSRNVSGEKNQAEIYQETNARVVGRGTRKHIYLKVTPQASVGILEGKCLAPKRSTRKVPQG